MNIDHKALSQALRTLDSAPKEIKATKHRYEQTLSEIRMQEQTGNYSPNYIKQKRESAKTDHDRVVDRLAESMKSALAVVKANNDYSSAEVKLDDPKLTNAFNIVSAMGKNTPYNTQISILNQFRGNPAALQVLEGLYRNNGLYFEKLAKDMQKPISSQAIEEMERTLAYYDYNVKKKGIYDLPIDKQAYWTKGEFAEQATRLGYDLKNESDPYEYALTEMQRVLNEERIYGDTETKAIATAQSIALGNAMQEISEAKRTGADESSVFNNALKQFERFEDKKQYTTE